MTSNRRGRYCAVVLLAIALLAAACNSERTVDTENIAADSQVPNAPTDVETPAPAAEPTEEPAEPADEPTAPEESPPPDEPALVPAIDGRLLQSQFTSLDPGRYRVETIGTPFTVTIDGDWWVQPNVDGRTVFTHPESQGPGDRDVVFLRPSDLADPTQPQASVEDQTGWPIDDIEGWLDAIVEGVVVGESQATTIGGYPAVTFDAKVLPAMCGDEEFCVGFATNNLVSSLVFEPSRYYRIFWIDQGDEPPIAIAIGTARANDPFVDRALGLLETVTFGEPAPNPVVVNGPLWEQGFGAEIPAGLAAMLPSFGGLEITLEEERFVGQPSDRWVFVRAGDVQGDVEIWQAVATVDGVPIASTDDLLAAFDAMTTSGLSVKEVEPAEFPLGEARVFDFERPGTGRPLDTARIATALPLQNAALWGVPDAGRLWVFETDRGVVVVSAESFLGSTQVTAMIEIAERLLPGLRFIDFAGE